MAEVRSWFHRAWLMFAAISLSLVVIWFGFFVLQVVQNIGLIRAGKPTVLQATQQKQFEASVSSLFANGDVTPGDLAQIEQGSNPTLGNPQAKVHIVEFVDYDCPFCKQAAPTIRDFMQKHMKDAYLVIRDFPIVELHPNAEQSAVAARCIFAQGNLDRYWLYYDRLFQSQEAHAPDDLSTFAQQVGANVTDFDKCRTALTPLPGIRASQQEGLQAGVAGTPTFFFNGVKFQGAMDEDSMETVFRAALKQASGGV